MVTKLMLLFAVVVQCSRARNMQKYCLTAPYGSDYTGSINTTVTGRTCQRWDSQYPHTHNFTNGEYFPDGTTEGAANYCRSPDAFDDGAWCYTTDPSYRWELCDIPTCHDMPECRLTDEGSEYRGSLSVTTSGAECLPWPEGHDDVDANFCRNPDSKHGGPWCFVEQQQWEYCSVPFCKPSASCITDNAYVGTVSLTDSGRFCQRWDVQWPHQHIYTDRQLFPDDSIEDAANYCRDPSGEEEKPWCYTTNPDVRWQYCHLPKCEDCRYTDEAREYSGTLSTTWLGADCQRWDLQTPHQHNLTDINRFPDASLDISSNHCRNPNGREGGPWCYTTDPDIEWDYCALPFCDASSNTRHRRIARHVLHIGVDGLDPCFVDAPGGTPNIVDRLGALGTWTTDGARSIIPAVSGPNWGAQLSGMRLELTGVTANSWAPSWRGNSVDITPVTGSKVAFPTVAGHLRAMDENLRTADFYNWGWIKYMAGRGNPGTLHKDSYCNNYYDGQDHRICDEYSTSNATAYVRDAWKAAESSYTFVYLGELDEVGHAYTWCNADYLDYVDIVDKQVGLLLDVVDEMNLWDEVLVIFSTDHGGSDYGHGWNNDSDIPVPMFIRGPGIKQNHEFEWTVSNHDIGATVAYALGLPPNPWWSSRAMREAFE